MLDHYTTRPSFSILYKKAQECNLPKRVQFPRLFVYSYCLVLSQYSGICGMFCVSFFSGKSLIATSLVKSMAAAEAAF